jgi:predicted AAA+ superfamily ATPase
MAVASGYDYASARADRSFWGRMVETVVGAHLNNTSDPGLLSYWRKGKLEVDFVIARGHKRTAIEVKSGNAARKMPGLDAFVSAYPDSKCIVIGESGVVLSEFLTHPAEHWL